jgi:L-fucose isomerase-like protein
MYDFKKCVLGVAPTRRDVFPDSRVDEIYIRAKQLAESNDVGFKGLQGLTEKGLLVENSDIEKIAAYFRESRIDALFVPHANFGQEEAVAKLCKALGKPVLIWGPRDDAPLGVPDQMLDRPYDVQCGLFATGKALQSYGVPFSYIENCWIDSEILDKGFESFIRTACAVKAFKNARVAQLSVRPWQFLSVRYNENEILEKFGIEVVPIESSEIILKTKKIMEESKDLVLQKITEWEQRVDLSSMDRDELFKMASVEIALKDVAESHGCNVMAGECWNMLQSAFGVMACFIWGALTDEGLPVTCEADVIGAVGAGMLFGVSRNESTPFFADITVRHPENDNAELLWHCGPFPASLAKEAADPKMIGGKGHWEIKGGDVTLLRIGCRRGEYTLFADEVRGTEGPKTNGNYLWVEVDDWPKWERKFVEGPYIHHISGVHGRYKKELAEATKFMGDITHDSV